MLTTDLICLLLLALWSIPLNHAPALGRVSQAGVEWAAGNRDKSVEGPPWVGRADRAQRNHHDNLATIAAVILIAAITGQNDSITAKAAIAILIFRILHGVFYYIGIGPARSLSYVGSILGLAVIVWRIIA